MATRLDRSFLWLLSQPIFCKICMIFRCLWYKYRAKNAAFTKLSHLKEKIIIRLCAKLQYPVYAFLYYLNFDFSSMAKIFASKSHSQIWQQDLNHCLLWKTKHFLKLSKIWTFLVFFAMVAEIGRLSLCIHQLIWQPKIGFLSFPSSEALEPIL